MLYPCPVFAAPHSAFTPPSALHVGEVLWAPRPPLAEKAKFTVNINTGVWQSSYPSQFKLIFQVRFFFFPEMLSNILLSPNILQPSLTNFVIQSGENKTVEVVQRDLFL